MFLVLDLYCLITSHPLIIVLAASGGADYIASLKNMGIGSVPFLLSARAIGLTLITGHAAFYNYYALDLAPGEDTKQLVSSIPFKKSQRALTEG